MTNFLTRASVRVLIGCALSLLSFGAADALAPIGTVDVTAVGSNSARVDVTHSGFSTAPADYRYEICWKKTSQITFICWANQFLTNNTSEVLTGLSSGTTYKMRVRCYCRKSIGPWPAVWREVKDEFNYTFYPPPPPPAPAPIVRVRGVQSGQCLFVDGNLRTRNWGCWNDPGMRFALETVPGGMKQLRHVNSGLCIYGWVPNVPSVLANACGLTGTRITLIPQTAGQVMISIPATGTGFQTGNGGCLSTGAANGGDASKAPCSGAPSQRFVLDPA